MIYNLELERRLLAGLLKYPKSFFKISDLIDEADFVGKTTSVNKVVFSVLKKSIVNNETVDPVVIAQKVKSFNVTFPSAKMQLESYLDSLVLQSVSEHSIEDIAKDLKKYTVRRNIYDACKVTAERMKSVSTDTSFSDIMKIADESYNQKLSVFENYGQENPINLYDIMEDLIEDRGNNPVKEFGFMGPFPKVNDIYGSLLRPGNITIIVARSGVGKTALALEYCDWVGHNYQVPILHFDNGEMSQEELAIRRCSALSGVSMHLLESGQWRQHSEQTVQKVRDTWTKIKDRKFYYHNVGGMKVDEMISVLKRFYLTHVGRGNKMIFSFDYIKTTFEGTDASKREWQVVGEMVDKFKKTIQKDILFEDNPMISMFSSVQSNRSGITNNRDANNIVDDESIVSLSDRITQIGSHIAILRHKTIDEIEQEGQQFGTHKLIFVKARHLGREYYKHIHPVRVGDELRRNFINLGFDNFHFEERGDLNDIAALMQAQIDIHENEVNE